ncbi:hypothetical protein [Streptococcus acidominimus]|uniref:hypothetical protein n=1 Tax=Streptococcus acidominimus TaxID=1326 RepID=UPI001430C006|nr:hypothetical protein [Streptococcus acidominimus]MBF0819130.1 hypothetical protein [Streptococcus acidominimus]MBF0838674.1 hypothetical protein [Streptococcus acidominimus]MBF0846833.1 hypothetical protein [Streptococcus danieliae]
MKRFYSFVKRVTEGPYGLSIHDVMETSWEDLMGVLDTTEAAEKEEVIDLVDFLGMI